MFQKGDVVRITCVRNDRAAWWPELDNHGLVNPSLVALRPLRVGDTGVVISSGVNATLQSFGGGYRYMNEYAVYEKINVPEG